MTEDYYMLLKIRRDATQDEVRRAYRRLALELHPDVNPDPDVAERFKEINRAYEVLSDVKKRQRYDRSRDYFQHSGGDAASPGERSPDISPADLDRLIASWGSAQDVLHAALLDQIDPVDNPYTALAAGDAIYAKMRLIYKLVEIGTVPAEKTMNFAVTSENADLTRQMIKAGGKATPEMLHEAVVNRSGGVAQALMMDGGVYPALKTMWYIKVNGLKSWKNALKQARTLNRPPLRLFGLNS
jgi:hypothetical protein